jgi:hypothetical protein
MNNSWGWWWVATLVLIGLLFFVLGYVILA